MHIQNFVTHSQQFLTPAKNLHILATNVVFSTFAGWHKAQLAYIVAVETHLL